mgnify:CR=1 FL=1
MATTGEERGLFLTLEGIDGCGKTTQAARLADALESAGCDVVRLREPGGTAISEKIRGLLLDPANVEMCPECELLLYEASRAQLVRQVISPALEHGAIVVCDRFFDSTLAYQEAARGLSSKVVRAANGLGSCGVTPSRTVVLDVDPALALARATAGGADRLEAEGMAFQARVRDGYLRLVGEEPDRVRLVDASGTPDDVYAALLGALADILPTSLSAGVEPHGCA